MSFEATELPEGEYIAIAIQLCGTVSVKCRPIITGQSRRKWESDHSVQYQTNKLTPDGDGDIYIPQRPKSERPVPQSWPKDSIVAKTGRSIFGFGRKKSGQQSDYNSMQTVSPTHKI